MKLLRYGPVGHEKPALLDAHGTVRDLSSLIPDIGPQQLSPAALDRLRAVDPASLPPVPDPGRIGCPVAGIGKFIAAGANYADHVKESGLPMPLEPVTFMKAVSSISGPDDPIVLPRGSRKTDWEVELAVVIGSAARYVPQDEALQFVAGYCVANDVSEREWQLEHGSQWSKGKGFDSFGPLGPWLVTRDEVPDPQALRLWTDLNGERVQDGSTASMIFGVARLVSYISSFVALLPGDVLITGTPPGVGLGRKPQVFLKPGDRLELGVEGLGVQHQRVITLAGAGA